MVRLCQPRPSGRTIVPVDACIAGLVQKLNDAGIHTLGSCCGHGLRPAEIIFEWQGKRYIITELQQEP